jgi:hypothetical protein
MKVCEFFFEYFSTNTLLFRFQRIYLFFSEKRLQDVWILHDVHYITTLLHPSFKHFEINPALHEKALDLTKSELLKRQSSTLFTNCTTIMKSPVSKTAPDRSSSSNTKSLLSQCFDVPKSDTSGTTPYNELEKYMDLDVQLNEDDDILSFWLQHKHKFPILFSIVKDFYAIPSSNTTLNDSFRRRKTQSPINAQGSVRKRSTSYCSCKRILNY